jgi:opacity protein-like surface antigen
MKNRFILESMGVLVSLTLLSFFPSQANATVEGVYLGGQVGYTALTGFQPYNNNIGFAGDLGIRTNPILDLGLHYHHSSHSGGINGLQINAASVSADFHVLEVNDFDFSLGLGPAFFFFNTLSTESNFGMTFDAAADVEVDDNLRVGLGWRYNTPFGTNTGANFMSIMMRLGYLFHF